MHYSYYRKEHSYDTHKRIVVMSKHVEMSCFVRIMKCTYTSRRWKLKAE